MASDKITMVFSSNYEYEIARLYVMLQTYKNACIDTEFLPFRRVTPRGASESERYDDVRYNVTGSSLFQVGITLTDDGGKLGGMWQFHLLDATHPGIPLRIFAHGFRQLVSDFYGEVKWVTFHGLYDIAYLVTLLTGAPLPDTIFEFMYLVGACFGRVFDLKAMAGAYADTLGDPERLGLERLAGMVGVKRVGKAHQAGSDSLVTGGVFAKFATVFGLDIHAYEGSLYGISIPAYGGQPTSDQIPVYVEYGYGYEPNPTTHAYMQNHHNGLVLYPCVM